MALAMPFWQGDASLLQMLGYQKCMGSGAQKCFFSISGWFGAEPGQDSPACAPCCRRPPVSPLPSELTSRACPCVPSIGQTLFQ